MSTDLPGKRLSHIDALRGIASFAVCWFHLTNGYANNSPVRISGQFGWLGVEVFFVISGFIIPYALYSSGYLLRHDWFKFVWKRIVRIDPPYLVAMLLALLLLYVSAMMPGFRGVQPDVSLTQVLLHLGYLNGIFGYPWLVVVFWTLAIEFQFYLFISIVFPLIRNERVSVLALTLMACLFASFLMPAEIYVFHYLGLFMLGISVFQYQVKLIGGKVCTLFLLLAATNVYFEMGTAVTAVGMASAMLILFAPQLGQSKILLFLGAISYSLYLLHVPVGGRVINFGTRYVESEIGHFVLSLCGLVVCLAAATVFWKLVELPAQKWSSRLKYKR